MKLNSLSLRLSTGLFMCAVSVSAFAQRSGGDAAGCAACGGVMFFFIALFVINIAVLVWVARDAKARGMDSGILWMLLVFFTSVIGLVIYLFSRPQGNLVQCPNCRNKRLQASLKCPHCGYGV